MSKEQIQEKKHCKRCAVNISSVNGALTEELEMKLSHYNLEFVSQISKENDEHIDIIDELNCFLDFSTIQGCSV
jgi:hypothetical protein